MNKITSSLTPTRFRLLLVVLMVLIFALGTVGFYFIQQNLSDYAKEVSFAVAAASSSEDSVSQLNKLESELKKLKDVNTKALSIVADSQSYGYQEQVIKDLTEYATRADVTITQYSFQTTTSAPATGATQDTAAANTAMAGLKPTSVSISLAEPIVYKKFLNFLRLIEQNLTKMQISGVSLSKGDGPDTVTTGSLTVEVYLR